MKKKIIAFYVSVELELHSNRIASMTATEIEKTKGKKVVLEIHIACYHVSNK